MTYTEKAIGTQVVLDFFNSLQVDVGRQALTQTNHH